MRVAACAPGRRVTVITAGKSFVLPSVPEVQPEPPPNPLEVAAAQLLERDAASRALFESTRKSMEEVVTRVDGSVAAVAAAQANVAASVAELADTMALPVKPIYDKQGKLIGAERVKKLGA